MSSTTSVTSTIATSSDDGDIFTSVAPSPSTVNSLGDSQPTPPSFSPNPPFSFSDPTTPVVSSTTSVVSAIATSSDDSDIFTSVAPSPTNVNSLGDSQPTPTDSTPSLPTAPAAAGNSDGSDPDDGSDDSGTDINLPPGGSKKSSSSDSSQDKLYSWGLIRKLWSQWCQGCCI